MDAASADAPRSAVAKTIEDVRSAGALTGVDIANVTAVSKATVSRWSAGSADPQPRTQPILSDLRYVVMRLSEFYTPEETRVWLYSRNELLGGKRAMDLIQSGQARTFRQRAGVTDLRLTCR